MSDNSGRFDGFSCFLGMTIAGLVCLFFGILLISDINGSWKQEAIDTGNGKFNEKTSYFEWIDHSEKSSRLSEKDE